MSLLKFMLEISHALLQCGKVLMPKRGRPLSNTPSSKKSRTFTPRPTNVVRYDETGHWPIRVVEKQRGLIQIEDKVICLSKKYLTEFGMNSPVRNENASDPFEFSILRSYDNNRLQEFVEINLPKLKE
ncbi:hypothetical protein QTP88_002646 [Uroleucon formosanum]